MSPPRGGIELMVDAEGLAKIVDELSDLSGLDGVFSGLCVQVYATAYRDVQRRFRVGLDKHQRRALETRLARVTLADHFGGRAL